MYLLPWCLCCSCTKKFLVGKGNRHESADEDEADMYGEHAEIVEREGIYVQMCLHMLSDSDEEYVHHIIS